LQIDINRKAILGNDNEKQIATFANGMVVRELIVDIDDKTCRHSWSARGEILTHHNASIQVFSNGGEKCRVVWIADLMPNEAAEAIDEMIQHGLNTMKQTLESSSAGMHPSRESGVMSIDDLLVTAGRLLTFGRFESIFGRIIRCLS
jgi:hypothetical protein